MRKRGSYSNKEISKDSTVWVGGGGLKESRLKLIFRCWRHFIASDLVGMAMIWDKWLGLRVEACCIIRSFCKRCFSWAPSSTRMPRSLVASARGLLSWWRHAVWLTCCKWMYPGWVCDLVMDSFQFEHGLWINTHSGTSKFKSKFLCLLCFCIPRTRTRLLFADSTSNFSNQIARSYAATCVLITR